MFRQEYGLYFTGKYKTPEKNPYFTGVKSDSVLDPALDDFGRYS